MKTAELKLKERLLIVEGISESYEIDKCGIFYRESGSHISDYIDGKFELVCKGSELTEKIVKDLVDTGSYNKTFKNYLTNDNHKSNQKHTALESFISSVESAGYYWKINPMLKVDGYSYVDLRCPIKYEHKFNQAESRTFNPEKTLIFKIIEK